MNPAALLALVVAGVCLAAFAAGSETAVVSCSKVRLHTSARAGSWRARMLERLVGSPEYFFSVVLVATNVAVIVCTAAATNLAVSLFGDAGAAAATAVMVPVILVLGEVIPKSVFLYHADRVAVAVAPFLKALGWIFFPLVVPSAWLVRALMRAAGMRSRRFNILSTREELVFLYRRGKTEGELERREQLIIDRVFRFGSVRARDLMAPMDRVVSFPVTASVDEVVAAAQRFTFSRFPILEGGRVVGVVSLFDLLGLDGGEKLASVMHKPFFARETETAEHLLVRLKNEALHLAVVAGERGEPLGIVTLENVLESIVGDIYNEYQGASFDEL